MPLSLLPELAVFPSHSGTFPFLSSSSSSSSSWNGLVRLSLLTRNVPRLDLVLTETFSFPSHIDRDRMKRVRTLSQGSRSLDARRRASPASTSPPAVCHGGTRFPPRERGRTH